MTREEEIKQASNQFSDTLVKRAEYDEDYAFRRVISHIVDGFRQGAQWADEHQKNPWISVEDRLPEIGEKVITITNKGKLLLVARTTQPPHHEQGGWRWEHYAGKVTHWMPIPETPKGGACHA